MPRFLVVSFSLAITAVPNCSVLAIFTPKLALMYINSFRYSEMYCIEEHLTLVAYTTRRIQGQVFSEWGESTMTSVS